MTATETRPTQAPSHRPRRLTRSRSNRMVAGVCAGFADYAGIDANIVRLVLVALTLLGGSGLLLYVVAWLIVPEE